MKAVAAFNQEKALVGAFSVIVQLCRLIVCNTNINCVYTWETWLLTPSQSERASASHFPNSYFFCLKLYMSSECLLWYLVYFTCKCLENESWMTFHSIQITDTSRADIISPIELIVTSANKYLEQWNDNCPCNKTQSAKYSSLSQISRKNTGNGGYQLCMTCDFNCMWTISGKGKIAEYFQ